MGRIIGLDVGERRIGVAVSDPSGTLARPVTTLRTSGLDGNALQVSLERVAERLKGAPHPHPLPASQGEGEPEDELEDERLDEPIAASPAEIQSELQRVLGFIERARRVAADDGKFKALRNALTFISGRARVGQGSDRVVIFTESLVTQADLREYVDFNREFLSAVGAAKREGKSVDEFVKTWTMPARYKGYAPAQPALLQRNVEGMYKELR